MNPKPLQRIQAQLNPTRKIFRLLRTVEVPALYRSSQHFQQRVVGIARVSRTAIESNCRVHLLRRRELDVVDGQSGVGPTRTVPTGFQRVRFLLDALQQFQPSLFTPGTSASHEIHVN